MKYLVGLLSTLFVVAATPADLASGVSLDGYHVDSGTSATAACVAEAVAEAHSSGGNLSVVVLVDEPSGGAAAFAGAMLVELAVPGTVFIVAPETVAYEQNEDFWSVDEIEAAAAESQRVASDNDVVRTFVNTLIGGSGTCSSASVAGKSSWGPIAFVLMVVGGVMFLTWRTFFGRREQTQQAYVER